MTESEFNQCADDVILQIEDALDECDADIDFENIGAVLTITMENDSKVIVNKQAPLSQIWVAAKSGGYHFNYDADTQKWLNDKDQQELFVALSQYCSEQSETAIELVKPLT